MTEPMYRRCIATPMGRLTLVATDTALRAVLFDGEAREGMDDLPTPGPGHAVLDTAEAQLSDYFAGSSAGFDLPLDLRGTEFQVAVWRSLAEIPYGQTSTYGAQAEAIGRPTAVRAVGAANGKNPVPIVLPCHRIVGKDGSLTGFAGGLDAKRFLLDHEAGVSPLPLG